MEVGAKQPGEASTHRGTAQKVVIVSEKRNGIKTVLRSQSAAAVTLACMGRKIVSHSGLFLWYSQPNKSGRPVGPNLWRETIVCHLAQACPTVQPPR